MDQTGKYQLRLVAFQILHIKYKKIWAKTSTLIRLKLKHPSEFRKTAYGILGVKIHQPFANLPEKFLKEKENLDNFLLWFYNNLNVYLKFLDEACS